MPPTPLDTPGVSNESESSCGYEALPHLFLELRGRGISLSAVDAEILCSWEQLQIPVPIIIDIALAMADECQAKLKPFPATLVPIDRRVRQHMRNLKGQ
jgi:hypothetical protein